jgi:hypothetical protein
VALCSLDVLGYSAFMALEQFVFWALCSVVQGKAIGMILDITLG